MLSIGEYVTIGGIVALFGLMWRIAQDNKQKVPYKEFNEVKEDVNRKVSYSSFDRYKEDVKRDFQSKDVCSVLVQEIKADLKEIKNDLKYLVRKNGGGE